jgi:hypothetical protein
MLQEYEWDVEKAVLEMYPCGSSVRKIAGLTEAQSKVRIGKDLLGRVMYNSSNQEVG